MSSATLRANIARLLARLDELGRVGALEGGGVCRLALTDEDRQGRDLVVSWMRALGLTITIDHIGNVIGTRAGMRDAPPVLMGSHIDTVATGGLYDGNLGVLAGLEVLATLDDAGVTTDHPIGVGFFTNEEGARFAPDMLGSGVHQGQLDLGECLRAVGIDGTSVGDDLARIGYAGNAPCDALRAAAYVELHIEQGPVLEREHIDIGVVEGVQGISWTEVTITGTSNHAGTTPMNMRADAGYVATALACFMRDMACDMGPGQVATVGSLELSPNLVNVVPNKAVMTLDIRNPDEATLARAEAQVFAELDRLTRAEGVTATRRRLARFEPVRFAPAMIDLVERTAKALGHTTRRMPSGAGHDAQMFAPRCPTAMIFVPSRGGISHNINEYTAPEQIEAGANVLLGVVLERAGVTRAT